jgi:arylamine N-acetyltransferase
VDVDGYLARLGLERPPAPTLGWLFAAQRAHVERVPWSTLDIHLGRAGSLDPVACVDRIVRTGRAGYCFQLNAAFGALLTAVGYEVRRHRGVVRSNPDVIRWPFPSHLALTVRLASGEGWFVDAGLGDALHEPIRLAEGPVAQGPCRYRMERIDGGWRFDHDPGAASFAAMEFEDVVAPPDAFDEPHAVLSTVPESSFVANVVVGRRDAAGVDKLVNQTLRRIWGPGAEDTRITSAGEFFAVLADRFGLDLADLDGDDRARLWREARIGQATFDASAGAPEVDHVAG